jgi:hypothetical protein
MKGILFEYEMPPATWAWVSSFMIAGIFFKFNRLFSVRNLDLVGLLCFVPGLLLLAHAQSRLGYIWLFSVGALFLVRLLLDPLMVRRPLLEPNLSAGGLTFTCIAMLLFLVANVVQGREIFNPDPQPGAPAAPVRNPAFPYFQVLVAFSSPSAELPESDPDKLRAARVLMVVDRVLAIVANLALLLGMVVIGYRHFDNIHTGVAAASLYLLLPYTAFMIGRIDHALPAALVVGAVAAYRRPVFSGILLGLAGGLTFYPLFLLPLWCSYYWQRGLIRFVVSVAAILLGLVLLLAATAGGAAKFIGEFKTTFGWGLLHGVDGFWQDKPVFRYPVLAVFVALCVGLALWPPQKNLGTLLSCSAAVMLGVQFWQSHQGGLYMAWYLPLLVLTIFRPNLEDRVALSAVIERRTPWRRTVRPRELSGGP